MNKYQKWIDKHSRLLSNPDAALDTEGRIGIQAGLNLLKCRAEYRDFVASADRYPQRDKIETLFGLMKQAAQFEEIAIRNAAKLAENVSGTGFQPGRSSRADSPDTSCQDTDREQVRCTGFQPEHTNRRGCEKQETGTRNPKSCLEDTTERSDSNSEYGGRTCSNNGRVKNSCLEDTTERNNTDCLGSGRSSKNPSCLEDTTERSDSNRVRSARKGTTPPTDRLEACTSTRMHLDQVLHLLPPELQERAATIRQEYVELAELHRDARNRADSGDKAYLKKLAESICHREDSIRNFWDQVNVHLKLAANVDVSPEEQQQLLEQAAKLERKEERKDGEYTYDELQTMMQQATTDEERKHVEYLATMRKENLKKYIRRNISKTPTFYANVRLKIKELKQFGDPLSPKVIAVGKEAGMTDEELRS